MKFKRLIQFITNVHRIHNSHYGYGWIFRPIPIAYFDGYDNLKNTSDYWALKNIKGFHLIDSFHDCTVTGKY